MKTHLRSILSSIAPVLVLGPSLAFGQELEPECFPIPKTEPMLQDDFSIETIRGSSVDEYWIHVPKEIGSFELDSVGIEYHEGEERQIVGVLDFRELDDSPQGSVTTLLLLARGVVPHVAIFLNYVDATASSCSETARRFKFELDSSER